MEIARVILLILHVAVASIAFAAGIGAAGTLKRAHARGRDVFAAATLEFRRRDLLAGIALLLTFVTGLALIFVLGGFKVAPPQYHAAMGVVLLMVGVGFLLLKPTATKLVTAAESNDGALAERLIKRVAMGTGIVHTLWLVTLALMFWHYIQ